MGRFFASVKREEFLTGLINERGYALGIEVGVREGDFSRYLLENTPIRLWGLDIQLTPTAQALVKEFPDRYELVEGRSPGYAAQVDVGFFDFIHIDADHSYKAVLADLRAWWPRLAPGGCLSGDDYADTDNPAEGRYGVVEAVNQFADEMGLTLRVVGCEDSREAQLAFAKLNGERASAYLRGNRHETFDNPCWYIIKPEERHE